MTVLDWVGQEYIPQLLDGFLNPQKRVSLIYLAIAAAITICWSLFMSAGVARKAIDHARRGLFGRHLWMSRSAHGDYKLLLANHAVLLLIAPLLCFQDGRSDRSFFLSHRVFARRDRNTGVRVAIGCRDCLHGFSVRAR